MNILRNAAENERPFLKYDMRCTEKTQYILIYTDENSIYSDHNVGET